MDKTGARGICRGRFFVQQKVCRLSLEQPLFRRIMERNRGERNVNVLPGGVKADVGGRVGRPQIRVNMRLELLKFCFGGTLVRRTEDRFAALFRGLLFLLALLVEF